ncbi:MAG: hypothetical protein ACLUSP_04870 [Christensenellales bacterium]
MFTGKPVKVVMYVIKRRNRRSPAHNQALSDSFSYVMPANEVYGKMNR